MRPLLIGTGSRTSELAASVSYARVCGLCSWSRLSWFPGSLDRVFRGQPRSRHRHDSDTYESTQSACPDSYPATLLMDTCEAPKVDFWRLKHNHQSKVSNRSSPSREESRFQWGQHNIPRWPNLNVSRWTDWSVEQTHPEAYALVDWWATTQSDQGQNGRDPPSWRAISPMWISLSLNYRTPRFFSQWSLSEFGQAMKISMRLTCSIQHIVIWQFKVLMVAD